ncbi:MAG: OmpA family protein [Pyrinomonadaceae bacterium]
MNNLKALVYTPLFFLAAFVTANAQADVARRTTAITYPLDEVVQVQFRGTTRYPRMKGEARIKRTGRTGSEIELSVSKMPRPFELGAGYATYVLWAVSPEGQIDNLGEIRRRGFFEFDSKINVTTPLQTFALIVTAEPHFLVRRPSQEIMLENLSPYAASGKKIVTTPSVQYFGNSSDYFRDARTPEIAEIDYSKTPSTILQAKQAIALARFAGAERDAAEEMTEAGSLLKNAEDSWKAGRDSDTVDIAARRAISAGVKAEQTAVVRKAAREKRNEQTRADAEIRQAEDKYVDAQAEIAALKAELAGETRGRELSERDVMNYSKQIQDLRSENANLREELTVAKLEADNSKVKLAEFESRETAARERGEREQRIAALEANEAALMASMKSFGTVRKNERGIVVTLPESIWAGPRLSSFAAGADSKLTSLTDILSSNPVYSVSIESHTDSRGTPEELQALTDERSKAIAERLTTLGVASGRLDARGLGATLPVAANTTNANRAKNRRVQLILVPNIQ